MLNKTEACAIRDRKGRASGPLIHKHAFSNRAQRRPSHWEPFDTLRTQAKKRSSHQVPCRDCASQLATRA
jgi:hypothetical protein